MADIDVYAAHHSQAVVRSEPQKWSTAKFMLFMNQATLKVPCSSRSVGTRRHIIRGKLNMLSPLTAKRALKHVHASFCRTMSLFSLIWTVSANDENGTETGRATILLESASNYIAIAAKTTRRFKSWGLFECLHHLLSFWWMLSAVSYLTCTREYLFHYLTCSSII